MGKNYRQGRLGEEIKKSISGYLLNGIKESPYQLLRCRVMEAMRPSSSHLSR